MVMGLDCGCDHSVARIATWSQKPGLHAFDSDRVHSLQFHTVLRDKTENQQNSEKNDCVSWINSNSPPPRPILIQKKCSDTDRFSEQSLTFTGTPAIERSVSPN
jgi:hypothetical protein